MKSGRSLVAKYQRMKGAELREVTRPFDEEMVIDSSRALTTAERRAWEVSARRSRGSWKAKLV